MMTNIIGLKSKRTKAAVNRVIAIYPEKFKAKGAGVMNTALKILRQEDTILDTESSKILDSCITL